MTSACCPPAKTRPRPSNRVVDAAYEKHSVAVTSNLHPAGFDTIMPKTLATATVDRLLHHAHLIVTEGPSHACRGHRGQGGGCHWPDKQERPSCPPTRISGVPRNRRSACPPNGRSWCPLTELTTLRSSPAPHARYCQLTETIRSSDELRSTPGSPVGRTADLLFRGPPEILVGGQLGRSCIRQWHHPLPSVARARRSEGPSVTMRWAWWRSLSTRGRGQGLGHDGVEAGGCRLLVTATLCFS